MVVYEKKGQVNHEFKYYIVNGRRTGTVPVRYGVDE